MESSLSPSSGLKVTLQPLQPHWCLFPHKQWVRNQQSVKSPFILLLHLRSLCIQTSLAIPLSAQPNFENFLHLSKDFWMSDKKTAKLLDIPVISKLHLQMYCAIHVQRIKYFLNLTSILCMCYVVAVAMCTLCMRNWRMQNALSFWCFLEASNLLCTRSAVELFRDCMCSMAGKCWICHLCLTWPCVSPWEILMANSIES